MNKPEQYIHHLQQYVMLKPKHDSGLCYWLTTMRQADAYHMVQAFRDGRGEPETASLYVSYFSGPVPQRVALARMVLEALRMGSLYYTPFGWKTRRPPFLNF